MTTTHKKRGLIWLAVSLTVAAIAQFVLIFPWGQLLNDFYPLSAFVVYTTAGTILYAFAGVFLALSLRSFGDALPPFTVRRLKKSFPFRVPKSPNPRNYWRTFIALSTLRL